MRRFDANSYLRDRQGDGPARRRPRPGRARGGDGAHPRAGAHDRHHAPTCSTRPTSSSRSATCSPRHGRPSRVRRDRQPPRPRRVPDRPRPGGRRRRPTSSTRSRRSTRRPVTAGRAARRVADTIAIRAGPRRDEHLARPRAVGDDRVRHADSSTKPVGWRRCRAPSASTAATATRRCSGFEDAVAELEGAEAALAFSSGMGAIATVVLALCSTGDHIVAQRQIYSGTQLFLQGACPRFGIDVTFVDGTEPGAFAAAVRPRDARCSSCRDAGQPAAGAGRPRRDRRDQRARSPWSTPRSPRRSCSGRSTTASTSCSTRRPRASPATTTRRSAWSRARRTCSTRSGRTRSCTARARRRSTR